MYKTYDTFWSEPAHVTPGRTPAHKIVLEVVGPEGSRTYIVVVWGPSSSLRRHGLYW